MLSLWSRDRQPFVPVSLGAWSVSLGACFVSLGAWFVSLGACTSLRDSSGMTVRTEQRADRTQGSGTPERAKANAPALVAIIDGRETVDAANLAPILTEIAGSTALREAVVDTRLARRLAAERIAIDAGRIAREEQLLLETIHSDSVRARELLAEIQLRQGLGAQRFAALLARNAGLRALVERNVTIDEEGLASMFDMLHGPKRVARIAVLGSRADAQQFALEAAANGGGAGRFADFAVASSLDESAARGGLLAPVARRDPSYPESLRTAIFATPLGGVSPPVLDGARWYVVFVAEERPGDGTSPTDARDRCARMLRLSRERLLMDALARELASLDGVTIFDRAYDTARMP